MGVLSRDTSPEMEELHLRLLRDLPPWRKMALLNQLIIAARQVAWQGLRQRYPDADEAELRRRFADLVLGPALAAQIHDKAEE